LLRRNYSGEVLIPAAPIMQYDSQAMVNKTDNVRIMYHLSASLQQL